MNFIGYESVLLIECANCDCAKLFFICNVLFTEKVVTLLQTLVDCEETVCQESHVPVLLGAYGASMSTLDQLILKV